MRGTVGNLRLPWFEFFNETTIKSLESLNFKMFSDFDSEVIGFDTSSTTERVVNDDSSQTLPLKYLSEETQTVESTSVGAQFVSEEVFNKSNSESYDVNKLLNFLQRIMPHLEEELQNFDSSLGLKDDSDINSEQTGTEGVEGNQLFSKQITFTPEFCKEKVVSDLTWNSTNALLAVACTEKNHEGWCSHETSVGLYRTQKDKFEKEPPDHLLQVSSCVRCIKFHPYIPSLLAGGFHNGEVVIWDLTNGETMLTNSKKSGDEVAHVDAVTCLVWRESRDNMWLISTGRDGKIIFWKITITNLNYESHEKFLIVKQQNLSPGNSLNDHVEILHIGFWSNKESDFIVAGGENLYHCSLTMKKNLVSNPNFKDPVSMIYQPHKGIVTCLSCCLTSDIFASCGIDSKIQIYKFKKTAPLHILHTNYPLMGIKWTGINCLASWGCFSKIERHKINVESGYYKTATVCEIEGHVSNFALNSARKKLAVGSTTGAVTILSDVALF